MNSSRNGPSPQAFEVPPPPPLSASEGDLLVRIALQAIRGQWMQDLGRIPLPAEGPLHSPAGTFVTLYKGESLRGCLGVVSTPEPLWRSVEEIALASATRDHRFEPLAEEEYPGLGVEVSVLGSLAILPAADPDRLVANLKVGVHGLMVRYRSRSGLLLPQVPERYGWDALHFLEETCYKAGLLGDAWRQDGAELMAFRCSIFKGRAES